ncbi:hypothetical protein ASJ81_12640 [Methanosarcina spelaei]|uniref:Uncharacterized protein n=1 Tax=Methanosarcina spelaei TaxID=1036679 RepID=A0A2A2HN38_9EURY|nr:hypothetical protein [Methanosarcina spelaei]PAV10758.1 hypothetical protein ASJ81_12640 [Methanosarcina spelaei]
MIIRNTGFREAIFSFGISSIKKETRKIWFHCSFKYSSIAFAAFLPAPIALITVAAPVTTSPSAKTPHLEVLPIHGWKSLPQAKLFKNFPFFDFIE